MKDSGSEPLRRRSFLKGAAAGTAAMAVAPPVGAAPPQSEAKADSPTTKQAELETGSPLNLEVQTTDHPGADFMVDVIKSLGFEYVCANPGSSFRGLHESLINHGGNRNPELITCCHEESSVAMAHGYAKIDGKPLAVFAHGTVGLQHAAMAVYNAYCDRVPVYLILGNNLNAATRRSFVDWTHSVQDAAAMVRDYTKWDDAPVSLVSFAESAIRAYKIAMTPPTMPVVLIADADLQENPIPAGESFVIPRLTTPIPPQADAAAIHELARRLIAAESPVLVAGRLARTPAALPLLIELAETIEAPVVDQRLRMSFPNRHRLNLTLDSNAVIANADFILGLEPHDLYGLVHSISQQLQFSSHLITKAKLASIGTGDLYAKSNYQDFQRYQDVDLAIAADAEATLPALIEALKRLSTSDRRAAFELRGRKFAALHQESMDKAREEAAYGWDASPISTARLSAEVWAQIQKEDWSFVSSLGFISAWPAKLWDFSKPYQYIGAQGGYGIGYGAPAAVGAALANRKHGRLTVNIQPDGDLLYAPAVLWTAAHHRIPLLTLMHNNRAYHQEVMQVQIMANQHNRGIERANIGTRIEDPHVDYAKLAQSMGVHGQGPIADPKELGPAMARALEVVKSGEPALIDVVTQPR